MPTIESCEDIIPVNILNICILFKIFMGSTCVSFLHEVEVSCCCSVTKSYPTLCSPMDCSMPGFPVFHCLPELA